MIIIIGRPKCAYCEKAKNYCGDIGKDYMYFDMSEYAEIKEFVVAMGAETVPQIFDGFNHIGGYEELIRYF